MAGAAGPRGPITTLRELVFVGGMIALASTGLGAVWQWPQPPMIEVAFEEHAVELTQTVYVREGTNESLLYPLAESNLTGVRIRFSFQDDIGAPRAAGDRVRIAVQGPSPHLAADTIRVANTSGPASGELEFQLATFPRDGTMSSADLAEVGARRSHVGVGTWSVLVATLSADDGRTMGDALLACDEHQASLGWCRRDPGNNVTLSFEHRRFLLSERPT